LPQKSSIHGELQKYWLQNNTNSFQDLLAKFIQRLTDRGHKIETISPLLLQVAATLDSASFRTQPRSNSNTLYIHLPYHPKGIQRQTVRQLYDKIRY